MADGDLAIDIRGLSRDFGALRALDEVSFQVPRGEVVALLGHNGAGKTTLLRILNGLLRPTSGTADTLGLDPTRDGQEVRARTGVLPEYPALDDFLTVRENLEAYGHMYGVDPAVVATRGPMLLADMGLADRTHTRTRDLSAGLKQRAALARAMLHSPELLLLDEPTSNLDPLAARRVRDLVTRQSRDLGTTVLVSTHNLAEASAIADRVVVLHQGRVLATGRIEELTRSDRHSRVAVSTTAACHARAQQVATAICGSIEQVRAANTFAVSTDVVTVQDLVRGLVSADVDLLAVIPRAPTLEDVYLSLHAKDESPSPVAALT